MLQNTAQLRMGRFAVSASAFALLLSGCVKNPNAPGAGNMGMASSDSTAAPAPKKDEPEAPVVPRKKGENIFVGVKWWVDPYANATLAVKRLKNSNNIEQSQLLAKIADNGGADWIGDWT